MLLIDTNIAIHWLEGEPATTERLRALDPPVALAAISRIELENGVYRDPEWSATRRAALDIILSRVVTLDFAAAEIAAYRAILEAVGYARARVFDRLIAATALASGLELATINGRDFDDIPGLKLRVWPSPIPPPSATPR